VSAWPQAALRDVCDIRIGRTPSRANPAYWGLGHPWATIADLARDPLSRTTETITDLAVEECRLRVVPAGTLLYSFKLTIGRMAVAGIPIFTNEAIAALSVRDAQGLNRDYLQFALGSLDTRRLTDNAVKGRTLNSASLGSLIVPLPPLDEQRRIAARLRELLADIGRLRLAVKATRESLESLEQGSFVVFEEVAGRNIDRSLADIAVVIRGVTFGASDARSTRVPGTLPVLRAGNIGALLKLSDDLIWVDTRFIAMSQKLRPGDIVVCMSSGSASLVGKSALLLEAFEGSVGAFCAIVRPGPQVDPAYLASFMRSPAFWSWRGRSAQGVGIQNLKVTGLSELLVPLPTLDEQRRIAARLREQLAEIDRAKAALETQRKAIETLPAALLREVFGEVIAA
jgi:type I restriction enzyme, S subunit